MTRGIGMRLLSLVLVACVIAVASGAAQAADAEIFDGGAVYKLPRRLSLVIGVSKIQDGNDMGAASLKNPPEDADLVGKALETLGFDPVIVNTGRTPEQLTRQLIKKKLYEFSLQLKQSDGGVGLIYFSGHAVEHGNEVYLLPYDAYIHTERDFQEELIPMRWLFEVFDEAKSPLGIVVLDTCLNDPFKPLPDYGFGLSNAVTYVHGANVMLWNSTVPGAVAYDGEDGGSPFSKAFAKAVVMPDLSAADVNEQIYEDMPYQGGPAEAAPSVSMHGPNFIFMPTIKTYHREATIINNALRTKDKRALQKYVRAYPSGYFRKVAMNLLTDGLFAETPEIPDPYAVAGGQGAAAAADSARSAETAPAAGAVPPAPDALAPALPTDEPVSIPSPLGGDVSPFDRGRYDRSFGRYLPRYGRPIRGDLGSTNWMQPLDPEPGPVIIDNGVRPMADRGFHADVFARADLPPLILLPDVIPDIAVSAEVPPQSAEEVVVAADAARTQKSAVVDFSGTAEVGAERLTDQSAASLDDVARTWQNSPADQRIKVRHYTGNAGSDDESLVDIMRESIILNELKNRNIPLANVDIESIATPLAGDAGKLLVEVSPID